MDLFATTEFWYFVLRWIHFLAGITWIGVLYYFNFIQTPFFATELGGTARSAMMRGLVPNALWWFRWGAMFTFLTGWAIVVIKMIDGGSSMVYYSLILTGGAMGTLMWVNVWFVIWPIQQVAIASANRVAEGGEADPRAAERAPTAARASRTNTLFSLPMLLFMGSASHLPQIAGAEPAHGLYWLIAGVVIVLIEGNIFFGVAATQRPLGSVSGTIHVGVWLSVLLFLNAFLVL